MYKKDIEPSYHFSLKPFNGQAHDYFLQNFVPENSKNYYHCTYSKKGQLKAEIFLSLNMDGQVISVPNAPFGGIWVFDKISAQEISDFAEDLIGNLKELGAQRITIHQAPSSYNRHSDLIGYVLHSKGFSLSSLRNHQILEGKKKIKKKLNDLFPGFSKKIKDSSLKITSGNIQRLNFLQEITSWNRLSGLDNFFNEQQLVRQISSFPERHFVISAALEDEYICHALVVKLTGDSLFYFLSGTNPKSQHKLLGELMMVYLLKLGVEQKVSIIDIGPSDAGGMPNHSLTYFKSKYANNSCNQLTWEIVL